MIGPVLFGVEVLSAEAVVVVVDGVSKEVVLGLGLGLVLVKGVGKAAIHFLRHSGLFTHLKKSVQCNLKIYLSIHLGGRFRFKTIRKMNIFCLL